MEVTIGAAAIYESSSTAQDAVQSARKAGIAQGQAGSSRGWGLRRPL